MKNEPGYCRAVSGAVVGPTCESGSHVYPWAAALAEKMLAQGREWMRKRLALMPSVWSKHIAAEHGRRGGLESSAANAWLVDVTKGAAGRLHMGATDGDIRAAAVEAARVAFDLAEHEIRSGAGHDGVRRALVIHCESWGIEPAWQEGEPGLLRMLCERWYLRRLRRAHARRAEGSAVAGGVVRRGLWPYASQDAVRRREDQRKRNEAAMQQAYAEASDGERVLMAEVVKGSLANPENKRAELMVRIRGCDGYAFVRGWGCEFWTMTTPSRFHAQRITGACAEANPNYQGATPREAQAWMCEVWAKARAAWKRRGLEVAGLRTAEPHHDGTPHWHLIVYGKAEDVRLARWILKRYLLADSGWEFGARQHRFDFKIAETGTGAAAYAAAYVSKNIDGGGMEGERDTETGRKVLDAVKRVDAWASHWSIRQFQFFGMPAVGIWRTLRRIEGGGLVGEVVNAKGEARRVESSGLPDGCALDVARRCADESDWCGFWQACERGGLALIKDAAGRLTEYGDEAAAVIRGVCEGGRRLMLKARDWVIHWGGAAKKRAGVAFGFTRSCLINCTEEDREARKLDIYLRDVRRMEAGFADQVAALLDFAGVGGCGPEKMSA